MNSGPSSSNPLVAILAGAGCRAALELALEPSWFTVVARADTLRQLLAAPLCELDAIVLDGGAVNLDHDHLRALRARFAGCRIVAVDRSDRPGAVLAALRAGADGYVPLADAAQRLSLTLAAVLSGQLCIPRQARATVAPPVLSLREREVLQLAAAGLTNGAIAAQLYLSESTVKTHLSSSFRKLGVASRAEAALAIAATPLALRAGALTDARDAERAVLIGAGN